MDTFIIKYINPVNKREAKKIIDANSPREAVKHIKNVVSVFRKSSDCRRDTLIKESEWKS